MVGPVVLTLAKDTPGSIRRDGGVAACGEPQAVPGHEVLLPVGAGA